MYVHEPNEYTVWCLHFAGLIFVNCCFFLNFVEIISRTRALLIHRTVAVKIYTEINFANDSKFTKFAKLKTHEI